MDNCKTQALPTIDDVSHTTVTVNSELNIPYEGKDSEEFGNPQFYALPNADRMRMVQRSCRERMKPVQNSFLRLNLRRVSVFLTLHDDQEPLIMR